MIKKTVLAIALLASLAACQPNDNSAQGFSLPEGDAQAGMLVFTSLGCNSCHQLPSVPQLPTDSSGQATVKLGGEVRHIKTYGELVTAIINPSHKILQSYASQHVSAEGGSAMRNYNDVMTVTQLINLVSFLQNEYHLQPFERSQYRAYYPGSDR